MQFYIFRIVVYTNVSSIAVCCLAVYNNCSCGAAFYHGMYAINNSSVVVFRLVMSNNSISIR